jgi:hypothetical protein
MGATWFRRGNEALDGTSRILVSASKRTGNTQKPTTTLSSLSRPEEGLEAHRPQDRLFEGIPVNPVKLAATLSLSA